MTDLATKGEAVEEWIDLHFFRPIGVRLARALAPTPVSADQVTMWSLVIGLVAGHLFYYTSPAINALGWALFIVSDILDSADGQLARIRGTSTRMGRILDGLADNARFASLYGHILARLIVHGGWPWMAAGGLVLAAVVSHSWQSAAVDFIRHAFLSVVDGDSGGSELELPEDATGRALPARLFAAYVRRQAHIFPMSVRLERRRRREGLPDRVRAVYQAAAEPLVARCGWLGQNARWALLLVTAVPGWPAGMLWITILPLNLALIFLVIDTERAAVRVLADADRTVDATRAEPVGAD